MKTIRFSLVLAVAASTVSSAALAQRSPAQNGQALTKEELVASFDGRAFRLAGHYDGCEVSQGGYGAPTIVRACSDARYNGSFSAWFWGGNELRMIRTGTTRPLKFYFYRDRRGFYVLDQERQRSEVIWIR